MLKVIQSRLMMQMKFYPIVAVGVMRPLSTAVKFDSVRKIIPKSKSSSKNTPTAATTTTDSIPELC